MNEWQETLKDDPEFQALVRAEKDPEFRSRLISDPASVLGRNRISVSHIKRFLERWSADPLFRERLKTDPKAAVTEVGLEVDPEELRPLWDPQADRSAELPLSALRYRAFLQLRVATRNALFASGIPKDERFADWRRRQIARSSIQMGPLERKEIVHAPACFELSKGCTVGCWFCGVGALKPGGQLAWIPENADLLRTALEAIRDLAGPEAARLTFLYWATDPLDNPHYEQFCEVYAEILGGYPQMTTAQPLKHLDRVRAILRTQLRTGDRMQVHRFSVLTLSQWTRLHQEFTPEELTFVELVAQNKGAVLIKANSGKYREQARRDPTLVNQEQAKVRELVEVQNAVSAAVKSEALSQLQPTTIACVSGFLFNLVERSIKLISPCPASDRWPLGYIVFEEARFADAAELKTRVDDLIARHMRPGLPERRAVAFLGDLQYETLPDGFQLRGRSGAVKWRNEALGRYLQDLGELCREGRNTAEVISRVLEGRHPVPGATTAETLNSLYRLGVLDEGGGAAA